MTHSAPDRTFAPLRMKGSTPWKPVLVRDRRGGQGRADAVNLASSALRGCSVNAQLHRPAAGQNMPGPRRLLPPANMPRVGVDRGFPSAGAAGLSAQKAWDALWHPELICIN